MSKLPPLDVVQLSGVHPGIEFSQGPIDLIHKIAAISQGKAHPMYVPMWVDDEELAARLAGDPAVLDTQQYYSQLDVVITGIGDWKSGSSSLCKIFPDTGAKLCFNKISLRMCVSRWSAGKGRFFIALLNVWDLAFRRINYKKPKK